VPQHLTLFRQDPDIQISDEHDHPSRFSSESGVCEGPPCPGRAFRSAPQTGVIGDQGAGTIFSESVPEKAPPAQNKPVTVPTV
jgi:hypothetical protein